MTFVLVTGATRGIGLAAASELSRRGCEVAIVGRDRRRVEAARAAAGAAHAHVADLASLAAVRRLAADILQEHPRIDVLALNAGAMFTSRRLTAEGLERTFALNHAGTFLLARELRDHVHGRIVVTASDAHYSGVPDLDDLQSERSFAPMRTYSTTKLWNVLFTRELARRLMAEGSETTVNCFHPGVVRTGFGRNDGALWRAALTIAGPFLRSPERGARSLVWLALAPEAAALNGAYVEDERVKPPSAPAQDDQLAAALWERTTALTSAG